jgi:surface polysaccharide O-acyltransferase-like enzyme
MAGSSRKLSIDTLRGLACILLVGFHVIGHDSTAGLRLPHEHVLPQINDALALLRMPLFSFLSGFVYAWRPYSGQPDVFLKAKVRRLIVPLLLVGTFFAVLQSYTPGANAGQYDWRLLHIVPVAHYWFLESLFIIFMLIVGLEHFGLIATPRRFALVWLASAGIFLVNPMPIYLGLQGATYLLPFFLLGLGSNRFGEKLPRAAVMLSTGAVLVALVLYLGLVARTLPNRAEFVALVISVCACVFLLRCHFEVRWLAWIGVYSFAIYLFHSMFSAASRIALLHLDVHSVPLLFVLGLLAGVSGPIVVAMVLKRVPGGHLPLGESKPKRARPAVAVAPYAETGVPKQN